MLWCDMVKTWCDKCYCMRWSCFVSYWQLAGALWLSLYCKKCKRHVIALLYHYALAIVVEPIVGEMTMTQRWRSRCRASDDGDHDVALEMEIKSTRWWWPYHVTYFDCMWCLSFMHLWKCVISIRGGWIGDFYKFVTEEILLEEFAKWRTTSSGISTQVQA
jgi:hypothetical protein